MNAGNPKDGETALMVAVKKRQRESVKVLITAKCDLDLKDNQGKRALIHAAMEGKAECLVELLIKAGANRSRKDKQGTTALGYAKAFNNYTWYIYTQPRVSNG